MDRLNTLLTQVLNRRGLQGQATASLAVYQAQDWLNRTLPAFASDLKASQLKDGILLIEAGNSIAAQECQQQLSLLKDYLQKECGLTHIEGVQLLRDRS